MLRLYLRDPASGLTVECPMTENHSGNSPIVSVTWALSEAVPKLAEKVARHSEKPVMEILLSRPEFMVMAKWNPDE